MPAQNQTLARALYDAGEFDEALKALGDEPDPLIRSLYAASIHFDAGRRELARQALLEASEYVDGAEPKLKARFYGQRAVTGDPDSALIDYEAARYWAEQSGDRRVEAAALNNLAGMYARAGRTDDALTTVESALRISVTLDEQVWRGRFLDQKAQILFTAGDYAGAVKSAEASLEILRQHGNPALIREAELTYGKALVALGSSYLDSNTIDGYQARRAVGLSASVGVEMLQSVLEQTGGHVLRASKLLGVAHPSLIKMIERHGLDRHPKQKRRFKNKTQTRKQKKL